MWRGELEDKAVRATVALTLEASLKPPLGEGRGGMCVGDKERQSFQTVTLVCFRHLCKAKMEYVGVS